MTISVAFTPVRQWTFLDRYIGNRPHPDPKIALLASIPELRGCPFEELGSTADIISVGPGELLAWGSAVGAQWWMPIEGWLLLVGGATPDRTVPVGRSVGWWDSPPDARLRVLRAARVLVMPRPRYLGLSPQLGAALAATLVTPGETAGITHRARALQ